MLVRGADVGHDEPMLPAITEVIDGLRRPQHVAQADPASIDDAWRGSAGVMHRQTVHLIADRERPGVAIEPANEVAALESAVS